MIASALLTLALLGLSSAAHNSASHDSAAPDIAAHTTVQLFVPGADKQELVAAIAGSDATATTYLVGCPRSADANHCGFPHPITFIEGPSTLHFTFNEPDLFTMNVDCSIGGTTTAVCVESAGGSQANFPGVSTTTYGASDMSYMTVTITASAGKAPSVSATATATATDSGMSSASSATDSASATDSIAVAAATITSSASVTNSGMSTITSAATTQVTDSAQSAASAAASSSSSAAKISTGGMPQITGNSHWAVGGAAVALAVAAL